MKTEVRPYDTSQTDLLDLTADVSEFASEQDGDGLVHLFAPHATAGLALIETGSGTEEDLRTAVDKLLPVGQRYVHSHGSRGHGRDHVLPAFISPSLTLVVVNGEVQLGTWQSVVLVDTNRDNPQRKVRFTFVSA